MEDEPLTAAEIWDDLEGVPLAIAESRAMPGRSGKLFAEDGSMRIAVIRPCVSRGKKIRGMHPIYTPRMLSENAAVFSDWPMYEDHMAEQALENFREQLLEKRMGDVIEFLEERARKIKELGGRVERSYFNPELTFEDDATFGYQAGGVEAVVFPQPRIKEMLANDPKILNVSINAWPTGGKPGNAPWDQSQRGLLIEGIRPKPRGSVDWVFRGGAGGRPLLAEEDAGLAVSLLEAYYAAEHGQGPLTEDEMKTLKELKPGDLREFLTEEAPHLLESLKDEDADPPAPKGNGNGVTEERLTELLAEQRTAFETALAEREEEIDQRVQAGIDEREGARELSAAALKLINEAERNGLPRRWGENLRARYAIFSSGPADGLKVQEADLTDGEGKEHTAAQVIEARVREDVKECFKLIEDAGGQARPRGLGASGLGEGEGGKPQAPKHSAWREHLRDTGDLKEATKDDDPSEDEQVAGFVREGRK